MKPIDCLVLKAKGHVQRLTVKTSLPHPPQHGFT